jgi:predicted site-specific integrase-resolvase
MTSIDGDLYAILWTTAEAAEAVGVDPGVIRIWAHRGHLKRANGRQGRPKYRAIDVLTAEKATREKARRSYAAA